MTGPAGRRSVHQRISPHLAFRPSALPTAKTPLSRQEIEPRTRANCRRRAVVPHLRRLPDRCDPRKSGCVPAASASPQHLSDAKCQPGTCKWSHSAAPVATECYPSVGPTPLPALCASSHGGPPGRKSLANCKCLPGWTDANCQSHEPLRPLVLLQEVHVQ